jgi:hypothetical protein
MEQDDRIISLENECLEKGKVINNEIILKESAIKELEVKNNSVMQFDHKYNKMRDEYDVHKFDVDSMTKEMREMRIKTNILIQDNDNLSRDKTNITNVLNETKELLISYQNKYTETNKKMIKISNDFGELKRNNLGNEEM